MPYGDDNPDARRVVTHGDLVRTLPVDAGQSQSNAGPGDAVDVPTERVNPVNPDGATAGPGTGTDSDNPEYR